LRTLACIGIVAMHVCANISVTPTDCWLTKVFIPWFSDFTLLFFMVSAFSMCCGYYTKVKERTISLNDFYRKRYLKILPFFALLVVIDNIVSPSFESVLQGYADILLAFGFIGYDITVIGVGWFLGTIFVFYIIFPWFVFLLDNKRRGWAVLVMAYLMHLILQYDFHCGSRSNILWTLPFLLIGGLIYLYRDTLSKWVRAHSIVMLAVAVLATVLFFIFPIRCSSTEMIVFALWLIYGVGTSNVVLNNKAVSFFSGISMEVYLCHMVMFRVVERMHLENIIGNANLTYVISLVMVLAGAIVFSVVAKRWVVPPIEKAIGKLL
jgi:peptidoglycan/LPS O-acetylase OafA/YrhL